MQQRGGDVEAPGAPPEAAAPPGDATEQAAAVDVASLGPAQQVPQAFRLERALNGTVAVAQAAWRRVPGSRWAQEYPRLGNERFQCVLTIPPGSVGSSELQLQLTLDPFRPNGGYRTPGFGNSVELREVQTGRRWTADETRRSRGPIVVNPDGVSGSFRHFILRPPDRPDDRPSFVILDGDWRVAA